MTTVQLLILILTTTTVISAFTTNISSGNSRSKPSLIARNHHNDVNADSDDVPTTFQPTQITQRRQFLSKLSTISTAAVTTAAFTTTTSPLPSFADDTAVAEATVEVASQVSKVKNTIEMKTFVDSKGLFIVNVPKRFFAIRRTVKGDLPDEATGKGRRGSSIFTAGDLAKAEVVAIERFPTKVLLEEEGIQANGDLSTFPSIGDPTAISNLIAIRRDRDKNIQARTIVVPNSVSVSEDGKTLYFGLQQEIDVQKPELLLEQTGVSELIRITLAKATLNSNDGQMMAVFASALQQDYASADGPALEETVNSFVALDQSTKAK